MTKTRCLLLWEQVSTGLFWKTLVLRVSFLRCIRILCMPVTLGRKKYKMSIKGQGWILAKILEFKQPKRISFKNHTGWGYINFRMLILLKTNRKFWFSSCLSSQFTDHTKLFIHSLIQQTFVKPSICQHGKCLSVKWNYCFLLSWHCCGKIGTF